MPITMLPDNAYIQFTPNMRICRLLNGMWQVSGAHGPVDPRSAIASMGDYQADGYMTWDLADHYGSAEDFVGLFRRTLSERGQSAPKDFQAFTKWVPRPMDITKKIVEQALDVSRRRMATQTLDLLQFHWWDYHHTGYLDALEHMAVLRDQGWVRHLALTNFDTEHMRLVTERGIRVVSNQVQYSIIDNRPEQQMIDYCQANGITLLAYGTFCGGLLSEKYLDAPEPGFSALNTASLRKYKNMIDVWGGWDLFQELLRAMQNIATKHGVTIANVAARYILDKPGVAGVIVGVRLGLTDHRVDNARVFRFALDQEDYAHLHTVTAKARDVYAALGDCGDEYRR